MVLHERLRAGSHAILDEFHSHLLDVPPSLFLEKGVHVITSERRARPGWGGYISPIFALATEGGAVVAARSDLVPAVRKEMASLSRAMPISDRDLGRLRSLSLRSVPYAYCLTGDILYVDADGFQPIRGLARRLERDDWRGTDLRRRFDGDVFFIPGGRNEVAAWAAVKLKSDTVWEIAVVTDPAYRGRGYAKQVVSAATEHILDKRRVPMYVHDRSNHASARVCRSLGYQEYSQTFFCEY